MEKEAELMKELGEVDESMPPQVEEEEEGLGIQDILALEGAEEDVELAPGEDEVEEVEPEEDEEEPEEEEKDALMADPETEPINPKSFDDQLE